MLNRVCELNVEYNTYRMLLPVRVLLFHLVVEDERGMLCSGVLEKRQLINSS